jgi:cysteinyl-tRNA synthetase
MHNGFVNIDNEKMSKSLGNFFTVRDVLKKYHPETVRFFIVRAHYRSPLNYSDVHLDDARNSLRRLYTALKLVQPEAQVVPIDWTSPFAARFKAAMDDDFGTPEGVAVLFDLAGEVNRTKSRQTASLLKALGGVLGLLQQDPDVYLQGRREVSGTGSTRQVQSARGDGVVSSLAPVLLTDDQIESFIAQRVAAKTIKNFAEADRIRQQLLAQGIVLKDSAQGTTWEAR